MTDRLCACGCGSVTTLATYNDPQRGIVKGEPVKWLKGHHRRKHPHGEPCIVEGCEREPEARGLCHSHFEFHRRHGVIPTSKVLETDLERLMAKVRKLPAADHWMWLGATASRGGEYGMIWFDGRNQPAHRVSWILHRGPIPDGLVIDHLCRVKLCVNPDHLEPVTNWENVSRGDAIPALNAAKTHCKRGHELVGDNLDDREPGHRRCRECARIRSREKMRRYRAAKKAEEDQQRPT